MSTLPSWSASTDLPLPTLEMILPPASSAPLPASAPEASLQSSDALPLNGWPAKSVDGKTGVPADTTSLTGVRSKRSINSSPAPANLVETQPEQLINPPLENYASTHISQFATPQQAARLAIQTWAKNKYGIAIDPDKTALVKLRYDQDAGKMNNDARYYGNHPPGPPYPGQVVDAKTLVQAMLSNDQQVGAGSFAEWTEDKWFPHAVAPDIVPSNQLRPGEHRIAEGIYRLDAAPDAYDASNRLAPLPSDFRQFVWDQDLHTPYMQSLDTFWSKHQAEYRNTAKIAFLKAAHLQASEHSLSDQGKALAWKAAGLSPEQGWEELSLHDIEQQAAPPEDIQVRQVDLYGYRSSMLQITDTRDGRSLLYTPGNSSPLHEFDNEAGMKTWLAEQAKDPVKRNALAAYFLPADRPQGIFHSGVDTALEGIGIYPEWVHLPYGRAGFTASGSWDPQTYINYKPNSLRQDMFTALTHMAKERSYTAADGIRTDARVSTERAAEGLDAAMNYLGPVAVAAPELWPAFAIGGVAQFGLGIDQIVNGQTAEDKAVGGKRAVFGLLNSAVPAIAGKIIKGTKTTASYAEGAPVLPWFKPPSRFNGQVGYLMGQERPIAFEPEPSQRAEAENIELPDLPGAEQPILPAESTQPVPTETGQPVTAGRQPGASMSTDEAKRALKEAKDLLEREGLEFAMPPFLKEEPPMPEEVARLVPMPTETDQISIPGEQGKKIKEKFQEYLARKEQWKKQSDDYQQLVDSHTQRLAELVRNRTEWQHESVIKEAHESYRLLQKLRRDAYQTVRHAEEDGLFTLNDAGTSFLQKHEWRLPWENGKLASPRHLHPSSEAALNNVKQLKVQYEAQLKQASGNRPVSLAELRRLHGDLQKELDNLIKKASDDKKLRLGEFQRRRNAIVWMTTVIGGIGSAIYAIERLAIKDNTTKQKDSAGT